MLERSTRQYTIKDNVNYSDQDKKEETINSNQQLKKVSRRIDLIFWIVLVQFITLLIISIYCFYYFDDWFVIIRTMLKK